MIYGCDARNEFVKNHDLDIEISVFEEFGDLFSSLLLGVGDSDKRCRVLIKKRYVRFVIGKNNVIEHFFREIIFDYAPDDLNAFFGETK
jgi:hypothetical protein